jgi:dihydroorotate dehydrogenase (fumarate)
VQYLEKLEEELIDWMEEHEYESVAQMRGSMSTQSVAEPAAFQRANYMKVLGSYTLKTTGR